MPKSEGLRKVPVREPRPYVVTGKLTGMTPTGEEVTVEHYLPGGAHFRLYWKGSWWDKFWPDTSERKFGITPRLKQSGSQKGHPSEPVIRAIWRYLMDEYNHGNPAVSYSSARE